VADEVVETVVVHVFLAAGWLTVPPQSNRRPREPNGPGIDGRRIEEAVA